MKKLIILSLSLLSVSCAQGAQQDNINKPKLSAALLVLWKKQHPEMSIQEFIKYLKTKNTRSNKFSSDNQKKNLKVDGKVLRQTAFNIFSQCTPACKEDDGLEERISNVLQRQECIESNVQEYIRYLTTKYAYLCAGKEFNEKFESGKSWDTENTYDLMKDEQIKKCVRKNVKNETKMLYAILTLMIEKNSYQEK